MEWREFTHVLPNSAYALHDYSQMGFPTGERYKGTSEQNEKIEQTFLRKMTFMQTHKVVAWNGEFGPVYADPRLEPDAETINQERYNLLGAQLAVYDKYQIPWSIWLYKDIGVQGMVHTNPDSLWNRTIQPFVEKKKKMQLDSWGKYPSDDVASWMAPLVKWIDGNCPEATNTYPTSWPTQRHLARNILECFVAQAFEMEFANLFKDFTMDQLDEAAKSFRFDQCVQRGGLNKIMSEHAEIHKKNGIGMV